MPPHESEKHKVSRRGQASSSNAEPSAGDTSFSAPVEVAGRSAELSNDGPIHGYLDNEYSSPATPSAGFDVDHNELQLVARIQSAIEHAQSPEPHNLTSHNHFRLAVQDPPSVSLHLLRHCDIATLISSSPTHETYSLPVPVAPPALRAPSEQWWAGLSAAEISAGPIRDEDVKSKAGRRRKSLTAKNGVLKQQREYMRETLRRQTLRLPMEGPISRKAEQEAMEKYGKEWGNLLAELDDEGPGVGAGEEDVDDDENDDVDM